MREEQRGPSGGEGFEGQGHGLRRTLGFWALFAYGVGDILGAGIYALVGKVAGIAGAATWAAFVGAMVVAALTALTYSELVTRYPQSAGAAHFALRALKRPWVAIVIGWMVFWSGVVSLATVTRAFAGYARVLWPVAPEWLVIVGVLVVLGLINFWGIRQSSSANIVATIVEGSGLLLVIIVGLVFVMGPGNSEGNASDAAAIPVTALGIAQGAALAFFAFIGFEDMVNVAEEVKHPKRHFPIAIQGALATAGVVYVVIAVIAVRVVAPGDLAASAGPLLEVVRVAAPRVPESLFTVIALFAVANTGLLNFIMASRLTYGMAREHLLPTWFHVAHPARRTPHRAIVLVFAAGLALAITGTVTYLAGTTSTLLLGVFATVHVALIAVKRRREEDAEAFHVPIAVPIAGLLSCAVLAVFVEAASLLSAAALTACGLALVAARRKYIRAESAAAFEE